MLEAIAATAQQTRNKILRTRDLMNEAQEVARIRVPKIYFKDLIEPLVGQSIRHGVEMHIG